MGMIGNYIAVDQEKLTAIINGDEDILEIDPEVYRTLDIDKTWQAILYLLCNDLFDGQPPMGYVVPMMEDNGIECELDFGAFYLNSEQVREASNYLSTLDDTAIKSKYDFHGLVENDVYPVMADEDAEEFYKYMYPHLSELKRFYRETADQGHSLIFYIM